MEINKISTKIKARGFRILWKSLKSLESLIFSSIFFKTLFIFSEFLENPPRSRGFAPRSPAGSEISPPGSEVLGPSRNPPIGAGLKSRFPGRGKSQKLFSLGCMVSGFLIRDVFELLSVLKSPQPNGNFECHHPPRPPDWLIGWRASRAPTRLVLLAISGN